MALWADYPPIRVADVGNDLIRGRVSFRPEFDAVAWSKFGFMIVILILGIIIAHEVNRSKLQKQEFVSSTVSSSSCVANTYISAAV